MDETLFANVDTYLEQTLLPTDPVLAAVLKANIEAGLPAIDVSATQGALLRLFVRMAGARRILEIGTLGGYSSIWMARGLPEDGRLITLEFDPHHAEVARANLERAGLGGKVEVRVGRALDTLPVLAGEGGDPFDFIFIDADKTSNEAYLDWAVKLSRPGTVIICDNVIRDGAVLDGASTNPSVVGSRAALRFMGGAGLFASAVQTVGAKGYDGFAIAIVDGEPS